ncbi:MAG: hypothetical protein RR145_02160, partial [Oscillospiraceae bacterium]
MNNICLNSHKKILKIGTRLLSILIILGILVTCIPIFAVDSLVTNVKLSGIYETFQTIKGEYTYSGLDSNLTFSWLSSSGETGDYLPLNGKNEKTLTLTGENADTWIKFKVSDGTNDYYSAPRHVGPVWGKQGQINGEPGNALSVVNKTTPVENIFTVGGQEFILLESTESDESKFLVYSKKAVGKRVFNASGGQLFDDMALWLNGEFKTNGADVKFPNEILNNINYENVWKIEQKMWEDTTERGVKAGLALISATELKKHCAKIGLFDEPGKAWWLRTPLGPQGDGNHVLCTSESEGNVGKVFSNNSQSSNL